MKKRKIMTKLLSAILILMLAVTVLPLQAEAAVRISQSSKVLFTGESFSLYVTGSGARVKWSSSNKKIATVTQKGRVTAKQTGTATIKAKAGKKTLKCTVTVKNKFSATDAAKKIACTLHDTGTGVVAILKNNNKITVSLQATMAFFAGGQMLDTSTDTNYAFESGTECALYFNAPKDANFDIVSYDDYKITMSVKEGSDSLICDSGKISVTSNFGTNNVSAEITNNSGKDLSTIIVSCVYYDASGNTIGYSHQYVKCKTNGSTDYVTYTFPRDANREFITPASHKMYVNCAYRYSWEK